MSRARCRILLHNARLCTTGRAIPCGWLVVEGGVIADLGEGTPAGKAPPPGRASDATFDLQGHILAPGLIDLHAHGALGHDTMDATPESLREMARFYARHGVTSFLATTMAASRDALLVALRNICAVQAEGTGGAALLGAHLEGPYLNMARRGAQAPEQVRGVDPAEYTLLLECGVRLLTLSPELVGSQQLIREAAARGCVVSLGHTCSSYEVVQSAIGMGARHVTHLFNGMEPLHHRVPGAVGAALTSDALTCELIADGIHVHPAVLDLAVRCKGTRGVVLVTDAMRGAGMADGDYELGGQLVSVRDGQARLADGRLAGSTLTLERGVANISTWAHVPLKEALEMASLNPARELGLQRHKGALAVGMDADLAVLRTQGQVERPLRAGEGLEVLLSMVAGKIVCQAPGLVTQGQPTSLAC